MALGDWLTARHCEMVIRLTQGETAKEFNVSVYEMPLGFSAHGVPVLLIGRTILNPLTKNP